MEYSSLKFAFIFMEWFGTVLSVERYDDTKKRKEIRQDDDTLTDFSYDYTSFCSFTIFFYFFSLSQSVTEQFFNGKKKLFESLGTVKE